MSDGDDSQPGTSTKGPRRQRLEAGFRGLGKSLEDFAAAAGIPVETLKQKADDGTLTDDLLDRVAKVWNTTRDKVGKLFEDHPDPDTEVMKVINALYESRLLVVSMGAFEQLVMIQQTLNKPMSPELARELVLNFGHPPVS